MAITLNRVTLLGNVGKDPDIRKTRDGKEVVSFTMATSDVWRDKETNEVKERTEWHKVVVFIPRLVTTAKKIVKGDKLLIEGSLQTRKWQDQTNVDKYVTEILLQSFDSKLEIINSHRADNSEMEEKSNDKKEEFDDDIPF